MSVYIPTYTMKTLNSTENFTPSEISLWLQPHRDPSMLNSNESPGKAGGLLNKITPQSPTY